jgi:hypothetical protein
MEEYYDGPDVVGTMDQGSSDLELCTEDNKQWVGIIYRNVQIPVGATITNAYVQFTCDDDNTEYVSLSIWGAREATVTAPFTTDLFGVSSHPRTTAEVNWEPPEWVNLEERGPAEQTPDLKAIIQEIIGLDGWAPGNNLMIILTDPDEATKIHRESEAYEDDTDFPSELFVTFTEGTGIVPINSGFSSLIYPNPTEGRLFIVNPTRDRFNYEIYSITGKLVISGRNIAGSGTEIDLSSLAKGAYFVNLITTEKTEVQKLILK